MTTRYASGNQKKSQSKKWILVTIIVIILLVIGGWLWHKHHHTAATASTVQTNSGTATANPNVPGGTTPNPTTGSGASKDAGDNTVGTSPGSGVQPTTPTGQFVSDHEPNLSGHPASNTETSACTTTPGVLCKISFTADGIVKSLPAQRTDANGSALWSNWTLQSIGLTKGTWKITAIAMNGSKSSSANDATPLVVSE